MAYYTTNRMVSSFSVRHEGHQIVSNSHRAIRRILDAVTGDIASLQDQLDYQYLTTLLAARARCRQRLFFRLRSILAAASRTGGKDLRETAAAVLQQFGHAEQRVALLPARVWKVA